MHCAATAYLTNFIKNVLGHIDGHRSCDPDCNCVARPAIDFDHFAVVTDMNACEKGVFLEVSDDDAVDRSAELFDDVRK